VKFADPPRPAILLSAFPFPLSQFLFSAFPGFRFMCFMPFMVDFPFAPWLFIRFPAFLVS
jgi:hypothetical protein